MSSWRKGKNCDYITASLHGSAQGWYLPWRRPSLTQVVWNGLGAVAMSSSNQWQGTTHAALVSCIANRMPKYVQSLSLSPDLHTRELFADLRRHTRSSPPVHFLRFSGRIERTNDAQPKAANLPLHRTGEGRSIRPVGPVLHRVLAGTPKRTGKNANHLQHSPSSVEGVLF